MKLLFDTNVWLDNYVPDRTSHDTVGRLIVLAACQGHDILYAAMTAKDVFYLINRYYKGAIADEGSICSGRAGAVNEIAWACVDNMAEIATAIGCDQSDMQIARKYKNLHADFEDDLVLSAALRARVDYLVTSDERLIRHAPVAALTPADMLNLLEG